MAAKSKTKQARELSADDLLRAEGAFVYDDEDTTSIARRLRVSTAYLDRKANLGNWQRKRERLCGSSDFVAGDAAAAKTVKECQTKIRVIHARTAVRRAKAQHAIAVALADEAANASTSKEVHAVARALGPASQDFTTGRLVVDLTTEKAEVVSAGELVGEIVDGIRAERDGSGGSGAVAGSEVGAAAP
jgi:hypothetical protein